MAAKQSMAQAIMQAIIKATKAAIIVIWEADNPVNNARSVHITPRSGSAALNTTTFDWKAEDKF